MAISKIIYQASASATPEVWMDVTGTTATVSDVASGKKFILANGTEGTGTASGGGGIGENDVNFIDYDGTILHSYSATEFASLSAMPANPSHTGLTAQGWNWSLSDAQSYVETYGKLWIGQMYVTSSNETEIDIKLVSARLAIYLGFAVNGTAEVDWGDGSSHDTVTGTSLTIQQRTLHTYATEGEYTIKIKVQSGQASLYGTTTYTLINANLTTNVDNRSYANAVTAVRIGKSMTIGQYAFSYCRNLKYVTIPNSVTSTGNNAFFNASCLYSITIPSGFTSIANNAFYYCMGLVFISIPITVTTIGSYSFEYCYQLKCLTIPSDVTSIGTYACSYCYACEYVIIPSSVTTISQYAFAYCYQLRSVTNPDKITNISNSMFSNCIRLNAFVIPTDVTNIDNSAFLGCNSLQTMTIPSKVVSIGSQAFSGCMDLLALHFQCTTPPTVSNSNTFTNLVQDCIIYVPKSLNQTVLATYTGATNYPSSSTYTYVEEVPTFKIDNYEYGFEVGMTWGQWCNSNYNTDEWESSGSGVYNETLARGMIVSATGEVGDVETSSDEIVAYKSYVLMEE